MREFYLKTITDIATRCMNRVIDAVFPPACPICGKPAPFENGTRRSMCKDCARQLAYIKSPYCMKCGKEIRNDATEYCYDCTKTSHQYTQGRAVFVYGDGIRQSIYRYKYKNKREYASFYAQEMARTCKETMECWSPQAILPIPLHQSKLRQRGFNQAELIATHLSGILSIPLDTQLLIRARKTVPMKELNEPQRRKNLENAFILQKPVVHYKKVMLIDDIYTTGATMDECASILMKHGVEEVYFVCLCVGKGF